MAAFGFSIGDFFAVGQFAWQVYKSCKSAGAAFTEVSHEVVALHTAIKELEDEIENPDSILNRTGAGKKDELGLLVKNCMGVLQQLNKVLIKYKSLGTTSKRAWDRLRWGTENLQEIREKLMMHTSSLTLFLTTLGTGSLGRIEKKLDQLIEDVRAGRREDTVLTIADDDEDESEIQWNLWKGELVEDGFSKVEIEGHKHWIRARLAELIESGGLNEQPLVRKGLSSRPTITTAKSDSPSNVTAPSKRASAFQPTVEDIDEDEEQHAKKEKGKAVERDSEDVDATNPEAENEEQIEEEEDDSSDFSDASDDTFLGPADSVSQVGLNSIIPETSVRDSKTNSPPTQPAQPKMTTPLRQSNHSTDPTDTTFTPEEWREGFQSDKKTAKTPRLVKSDFLRGEQEAPFQTEAAENTRVPPKEREESKSQKRSAPEPVRYIIDNGRSVPILSRHSVREDRLADSDSELTKVKLDPQYGSEHVMYTSTWKDEYDSGASDNDSTRAVKGAQKKTRDKARHRGAEEKNSRTVYVEDDSADDNQRPLRSGNKTSWMREEEIRRREEDLSQLEHRARQAERESRRQSHAPLYSEEIPAPKRQDSYYPPEAAAAPVSTARPKMPPRFDSNRRSAAEHYNPDAPPARPASGYQFPPPKTPSGHRGYRYQPSGNLGPSGPFSNDEGKADFHFANPEALFSEFLRGQAGNGEADPFEDIFGGKTRTSTPEPTVVERPLPLTLDELFRGVHKKMKIKRKRFNKKIEEKILEMDIKPGLKKGSKIKFKGVGDEEDEGFFQDLHFIIEEKPHPLYTRDGDDIHLRIELTLLESLCGWERFVSTIDGKNILIQKAGPTQYGSKNIYPELGMPLPKKPDTRGRFIVTVDVRYPMSLSPLQKRKIREALDGQD